MKKIILATSVVLATCSAASFAATATANFNVTATVTGACYISNTIADLAFGNIDVLDGTNTDSTTTFDVTCTSGDAFNIGLNEGSNSNAGQNRMKLAGGTSYLNYNLYSDSARNVAWGDTIGTNTVSGTGDGSAATYTVYGQVPSGQTGLLRGDYSDQVQVTVTYP